MPGWGAELPVERVLREMGSLGLTATERGSPGYFPDEPDALRATIEAQGLKMIGGFVPLVIHDQREEQAVIEAAEAAARLMSQAGGHLFISSAVMTWDWAPRGPVDDEGWQQAVKMLSIIDEIVAEYDMIQALHPHLGTIVENDDDVRRILDSSDVGWTLDTGHLLIGGTDPLAFAREAFDRIRHVHLKDVHLDLATPVFAGEQSIMEGVQAGMFCNLGSGDVAIAEIVTALEEQGYEDWYVIEQDEAITDGFPAEGSGPILGIAESIEYLRAVDADLSSSVSGEAR